MKHLLTVESKAIQHLADELIENSLPRTSLVLNDALNTYLHKRSGIHNLLAEIKTAWLENALERVKRK